MFKFVFWPSIPDDQVMSLFIKDPGELGDIKKEHG